VLEATTGISLALALGALRFHNIKKPRILTCIQKLYPVEQIRDSVQSSVNFKGQMLE
jgi:hypothetical protein